MQGPIALCCISLKNQNCHITEADVNNLFKDLASISQILIFQKEQTFKCFIEFAGISAFENALRNIDRVSNVYGRISLYHSKKDSLKNAHVFNSNYLKTEPKNGPKISQLSSHSDVSRDIELSKPSHSSNELAKNSLKNVLNHNQEKPNLLSEVFIQEFLEISAKQKKEIKTQTYFDSLEKKFVIFDDQNLPERKIEQVKIILIENICFKTVKLKTIKNLLGCYGNLQKIVVNYTRQRVFAEFEDYNQANLSHIYLDKINFFGSVFSISYTSALSMLPCLDESLHDLEFHQIDVKEHKFKNHLSIKFNPPSPILHLTSISKKVDHVILYQLISQIHEPTKIYKLLKRTNKSDMFLMEFAAISQSVEVLSIMHNKIIDGKVLKISFSHPGID